MENVIVCTTGAIFAKLRSEYCTDHKIKRTSEIGPNCFLVRQNIKPSTVSLLNREVERHAGLAKFSGFINFHAIRKRNAASVNILLVSSVLV